MARFNEDKPSAEFNATFKAHDTGYCPRCDNYGRCSFGLYVINGEERWHVCQVEICLTCQGKKRNGQFITLFTGTNRNPDFTCRGIKLPPGISKETITNAVRENPTRRWFNLDELAQYRTKFF